MNLTLTLRNWEEIFFIHNIDIVDELDWDYYCLNEGTANDDTEATLNLAQISRLSPLDSVKVCELIRSIKRL
ncbi:MAG TPA: hypothetical protein PLF17_09845 [Chitinophagaceae bacterium]|nr:hypothetical protein [Chitinophagaceae bacterium]